MLNGGPLSLFRTSGIPCLARIASNFGIVLLLLVLTLEFLLLGNGYIPQGLPLNIILTENVQQNLWRLPYMDHLEIRSSLEVPALLCSWARRLGKEGSCLSSFRPDWSLFVFTTPWCPVCARSTALFRRECGITRRCPLRIVPSWTNNSSLTFMTSPPLSSFNGFG